MMIDQEVSGGNRIVARFALCCEGASSEGERMFHCDRAGFYGTYLLPDVKKNADGSFTASYLMSTWDPYNVALMQATFE